MLKMKKEEQELLYFIIGEREENFVYPALSGHYKKRIHQTFIIYDMKGVNLMKLYLKLLPIMKLGSNIFSKYYPGSLYKLLVVNAGFSKIL